MKISTRISEINERIELLYRVAITDFMATVVMAEVEALESERYRLECLLTPHIDRKCVRFFEKVCTRPIVAKDIIFNSNLN